MNDLFERPFPLNIVDENRSMFTDEFIAWLPLNLHVFSEFCSRAIEIRKRGRKRYGAKTIIEVIRYETDVRSNPDTEFKINNTHTAYLSRLSMLAYPEIDGLFETREKALNFPKEYQETRDFVG